MPPTDPRLLAASIEEIQLDLELEQHIRGEEPWQCATCEGWTYRPFCPLCLTEPKALSPIGKLMEREAAGEDIDWREYEKALYGDRVSQDGGRSGSRPDSR